jgi:hypothetical protein
LQKAGRIKMGSAKVRDCKKERPWLGRMGSFPGYWPKIPIARSWICLSRQARLYMLRPNDKVRPFFYARLAAELDAKGAKWEKRTNSLKNVCVSVRRPLALAALAGVFKRWIVGPGGYVLWVIPGRAKNRPIKR